MIKISLTPSALVMLALISACSTAPKTTSLLESTREDYRLAQNNQQMMLMAPGEMRDATDAMTLANNAAQAQDSADKIDQLAYLAKQKIDLAQEAVKQKTAQAQIAGAAKERNRMQLNQRTEEADQAKVRADQAEIASHVAQNDTQNAQLQVAALSQSLADLKAQTTSRGVVITLGDLLFATDDARLKPDGMRMTQKLAKVLQDNPLQKVLIEGHTDSTGSKAHNQELSERRADAVSNALQSDGVSRERIMVRGYGEAYPLTDNLTSENRQLNRRVEIVLSDANGNIVSR